MPSPHKALFLDRDGVINADIGYAYLPEQITFTPGLFDFCRRAQVLGYKIIVITNQAGITRGYYTETDFHNLMRWMGERFAAESCPLTAYYHCPHHPDFGPPCACRKPAPGMVLTAIAEHHIDPGASILIGDKPHDIEAAGAAGIGQPHLFDGLHWPVLCASAL